MTPRLQATVAAVVLLVGFVAIALWRPVDYVVLGPGPTVDVLGRVGGAPRITVAGHDVYQDAGQLRLVTVVESSYDHHVSLPEALLNWITPDGDAYPRSAIYPEKSGAAVQQQQAFEMTSSQDLAVAAALHQMNIPVPAAAKVSLVDPKGPAASALKPGDLLLTVNGTAVSKTAEAVAAIRALPPGSTLSLGIKRGDQPLTVTVTTDALGADGAAKAQSHLGVQLSPGFQFPFKVSISVTDGIGGPSAGLMFALSVYDVLNPGGITGGHVVAGTGTIDASGKVGEIGGIKQKIAGAQRDHAQLFFVPAGNCDEARQADYDHSKIELVKVSTMSDALQALKTWTADPKASLPGCNS